MKREYYSYHCRLNGEEFYLIWFTDEEEDGVFIKEIGVVPSFKNLEDLQIYSKENKIRVNAESDNLLNLDLIQEWLTEKRSKIQDYNNFLSAWNLFDDISRSISGNSEINRKLTAKIYDKIFWGCNISAVTPEGKFYEPIWTKKELQIIHQILNVGVKMFKEKVAMREK